MIDFEPLEITAVNTRNILIQWFLEPTNENLNDVVFEIYRGFSKNNVTTKIGEVSGSQFYFVDNDTPAVSKWDEIWYKITAVTPSNSYDSDPGHLLGVPRGRILVINNAARVIFRTQSGASVLLYKKRREGARCPECYDKLEGVVKNDSCAVCFGTGFVQGYYPPLRTRCLIAPHTEQRDFSSHNHEPAATTATLMRFPRVRVNDVLYEENAGRWWYVGSVQPFEDRRVLVAQEVSLKQADPHDKIVDILEPDLAGFLTLPVV